MKNEFLFSRIKKLVATERRIGVEILEILYEIEIRKAYAELKYDGLFTYCVRELGFSDAQAYQRIQAMRALKDLPELKPLIESGLLSVSSVSKVQTHLKKERRAGAVIPKASRLEFFQSMENLSSREVDRKLLEAKGEKPKAKLVLEMDEELEGLWKQVKDLSARRAQAQDAEVLKILAREWLKRNDPRREVRTEKPKTPSVVNVQSHGATTRSRTRTIKKNEKPFLSQRAPFLRVPLSAPIRRFVWRRDEGKCRHCGSSHALEIDHIRPVARGGGNSSENLRLLCRNCHGYATAQNFGFRDSLARD